MVAEQRLISLPWPGVDSRVCGPYQKLEDGESPNLRLHSQTACGYTEQITNMNCIKLALAASSNHYPFPDLHPDSHGNI
jgi:hypothetical protein